MISGIFLTLSILCVSLSATAMPLDYGDPTQPSPGFGKPVAEQAPVSEVPPPPRWQLSSTLIAGQRRVAVINGRSVALGARIEGAKLIAVDARGAMIEHEGQRIRLQMPAAAGKSIAAKRPSH